MADTLPVVTSNDGPRIVVDDFLKDPLRIPTLVVDMAKQGFIADSVLRKAGEVASGAVKYYTSTPPYADDDAVVRGEAAEVPLAQTSLGTPSVAYAEERALGIRVTDEMRRRQATDPVTRQLTQVKNTMTKTWADKFLNLLLDSGTQVTRKTDTPAGPITGGWDSTSTASDIRHDINALRKAVQTAKTSRGASFGFKADVMIIGETLAFDLLNQEDFNKVYQGNLADENLLYTGVLPQKILGLNVLVTPEMDALAETKVIVAQRGMCGGIADEIPLRASALYRVEEKKLWRSDVQRASAMFLDQPLSVAVADVS